MDWTKHTIRYEFSFRMVSCKNVDSSTSEFKGVVLDGSTISAGWFTDVRTSASLKTIDDNWDGESWIRIILKATDEDGNTHRKTIGTYVVKNRTEDYDHGSWVRKYELQSALYTLSTEKLWHPITIAEGTSRRKAIETLCYRSGRQFNFKDMADYSFTTNATYDAGTTVLSDLFDLVQYGADQRVDVDPDGRINIKPWAYRKNKSYIWSFDPKNFKTTIIGAIKRDANLEEMASEVAVMLKKGDDERHSRESLKVNGGTGWYRRGFNITNFYTVNVDDEDDVTQSNADWYASKYANKQRGETLSYSFKTSYIDLWIGDVVRLWVYDSNKRYGGWERLFVKTLDINMHDMTMSLNLKTVYEDEE